MKYTHTKGMGQISSMNAEYERECQLMLDAGVRWLLCKKDDMYLPPANGPACNFYILNETSGSVAQLQAVFRQVLNDDSPATLSQMHAVLRRLLFINQYGWDEYVRVCESMHTRPESDARDIEALVCTPDETVQGDFTYLGTYFQQSRQEPSFDAHLHIGVSGNLFWSEPLFLWKSEVVYARDRRSVYPMWVALVAGSVRDGVVHENKTFVMKYGDYPHN